MGRSDLTSRDAPVEMTPPAFGEAGHRLVDEIAAFLGSLSRRLVALDGSHLGKLNEERPDTLRLR